MKIKKIVSTLLTFTLATNAMAFSGYGYKVLNEKMSGNVQGGIIHYDEALPIKNYKMTEDIGADAKDVTSTVGAMTRVSSDFEVFIQNTQTFPMRYQITYKVQCLSYKNLYSYGIEVAPGGKFGDTAGLFFDKQYPIKARYSIEGSTELDMSTKKKAQSFATLAIQ